MTELDERQEMADELHQSLLETIREFEDTLAEANGRLTPRQEEVIRAGAVRLRMLLPDIYEMHDELAEERKTK